VSKVYVKTFIIKTYGPNKLFDITDRVEKIVEESPVENGVVTVFSHGSTGALVRLKPEQVEDYSYALWDLVPIKGWQHPGNAYAHLRSTLISTKLTLPVINRKVVLGPARVYFVENQCYVARERHITVVVEGE